MEWAPPWRVKAFLLRAASFSRILSTFLLVSSNFFNTGSYLLFVFFHNIWFVCQSKNKKEGQKERKIVRERIFFQTLSFFFVKPFSRFSAPSKILDSNSSCFSKSWMVSSNFSSSIFDSNQKNKRKKKIERRRKRKKKKKKEKKKRKTFLSSSQVECNEKEIKFLTFPLKRIEAVVTLCWEVLGTRSTGELGADIFSLSQYTENCSNSWPQATSNQRIDFSIHVDLNLPVEKEWKKKKKNGEGLLISAIKKSDPFFDQKRKEKNNFKKKKKEEISLTRNLEGKLMVRVSKEKRKWKKRKKKRKKKKEKKKVKRAFHKIPSNPQKQKTDHEAIPTHTHRDSKRRWGAGQLKSGFRRNDERKKWKPELISIKILFNSIK